MEEHTGPDVNRRTYLTATATGAALLAAQALAGPAQADPGAPKGDTLYGHGLVWNRELPGVAGKLRLSFDLRVNLETGQGFGTATDPLYPDWDVHFAIHAVEQDKRPKGETRFTMRGEVTEANNPDQVGLPVKILAETAGDTTAIAMALGERAFAGAGLVVIAIIAILIGLLLPAVQKVR